MNSYKFLYLCWLLPLCFLFLFCHQGAVYMGITDTYKNGNSYTSEITDFQIKKVAAQTNAWVALRFRTKTGDEIQQKLSLPIEMTKQLQQIRVVPIRYKPDSFEEIVLMPAYKIQKSLIWMNLGIAFAGLLITFIIAFFCHKYANKKLKSDDPEMVIERIN